MLSQQTQSDIAAYNLLTVIYLMKYSYPVVLIESIASLMEIAHHVLIICDQVLKHTHFYLITFNTTTTGADLEEWMS